MRGSNFICAFNKEHILLDKRLNLFCLLISCRNYFRHTHLLSVSEQLEDVPISTDRKPSGFHRGPNRRRTSETEAEEYRFIKRWDLKMRENWNELEPFRSLPKPKCQFGNEATEIVWPYALLLERVIKVHPFTKSIYVYYSQRQCTDNGKLCAKVVRRFAHEFLIPITFHNPQVYVETEMLLEYNETPWVVIHCLDGRSKLLSVNAASDKNPTQNVSTLLADVVTACSQLGETVNNPKEITRLLNERPLQNQYIRINYQWFGDTAEERMSHLVRWDFDCQDVQPKIHSCKRHVLNWLNFDGNLPAHISVRTNVSRESARRAKPSIVGSVKTFFNSAGARADARRGRFNNSSESNYRESNRAPE